MNVRDLNSKAFSTFTSRQPLVHWTRRRLSNSQFGVAWASSPASSGGVPPQNPSNGETPSELAAGTATLQTQNEQAKRPGRVAGPMSFLESYRRDQPQKLVFQVVAVESRGSLFIGRTAVAD